jgi:hypothetical protein
VQATSVPQSLSRTPLILHTEQDGICMSMDGYRTFIVMAVALVALTITIATVVLVRNNACRKH